MKVNVTALSGYLYCPRKLYLESVRKIREPPKGSMVKGSIKHNIFDRVNKVEEGIVCSIVRPIKFTDLLMQYRRSYYKVAFEVLDSNKPVMKQLGINPTELFHTIWPMYLEEARTRSQNVFNFFRKEQVYGKKLWESLWPKYMTEIKVDSDDLKLKGIVDRIEMYQKEIFPVELKSGRMPMRGVWPGHGIQIGAYVMLLREKFKKIVKHGYIDYLDAKERRLVAVNPFMEDNVKNTTKEVIELMQQENLPDFCENKNKCEKCGLKEECYKLK
jgi:CRISPR-associated protein Cas4